MAAKRTVTQIRARKACDEVATMPKYGAIVIAIDCENAISDSAVSAPAVLAIASLEKLLMKMYEQYDGSPSANFMSAMAVHMLKDLGVTLGELSDTIANRENSEKGNA